MNVDHCTGYLIENNQMSPISYLPFYKYNWSSDRDSIKKPQQVLILFEGQLNMQNALQ